MIKKSNKISAAAGFVLFSILYVVSLNRIAGEFTSSRFYIATVSYLLIIFLVYKRWKQPPKKENP